MSRQARRHPLVVLVAVLCAAAIGGLFVAVLRHSLRSTGEDADVVQLERQGVVYMHPLTTLVGELVEARSAAVSGTAVDKDALAKALDAVGRADSSVGPALQTRQRFADLRTRVLAEMDRQTAPRDSYFRYTDVVALAADLIQRVGDNSHLANDRDLDSYYLMDSALIRLPAAMVYAGQATDLVTLAGGRELDGEDKIKAAVARFGVAAAAEQVVNGLSKSVDLTARAQLGSNIAKQLDAFRAAVDSFAPPTMLAQLSNAVTAKQLGEAAKQVFATALPFSHRLLSELDALLAAREDRLVADSRFVTSSAQTATAIAILLVVLLVGTWVRDRVLDRRARLAAIVPTPAVARASVSPGGLADPKDLLDHSGDLVTAALERPAFRRPRGRPDAQ